MTVVVRMSRGDAAMCRIARRHLSWLICQPDSLPAGVHTHTAGISSLASAEYSRCVPPIAVNYVLVKR